MPDLIRIRVTITHLHPVADLVTAPVCYEAELPAVAAGHLERSIANLLRAFDWTRIEPNASQPLGGWELDWLTATPQTNGCWLWTGPVDGHGYGRMGKDRPHRKVYEVMVGDIPAGHDLDHLCLTHLCVNPLHLEPVTRAENSRRQFLPERRAAAIATLRAQRSDLIDQTVAIDLKIHRLENRGSWLPLDPFPAAATAIAEVFDLPPTLVDDRDVRHERLEADGDTQHYE